MREFDPPTSTDTRKSSTDTRRSSTGIRERLPQVDGIDPQENPKNPDSPYLTGVGFAAARGKQGIEGIENGETDAEGIATSTATDMPALTLPTASPRHTDVAHRHPENSEGGSA